jgi:manganese transport protein
MSAVKPEILPERPPWWRALGPALITACVVFGPGSLLISSNVGANHGYELIWVLALTALLMGTYMTMSARVGVVGGATPCTLVAGRVGRWFAALIGINLCLVCSAFQFSNNVALATALGAFLPGPWALWGLVLVNTLIIIFLFTAGHVYRILERGMKIMVGVILVSFAFNLFAARPDPVGVIKGLIPSLPDGVTIGVPRLVGGAVDDPMILVASLLGTTFSVAGAFYQGNLVREKGWDIRDYRRGIGDSIAGVIVLTSVSAIIMITAATVIRGLPADNIGTLARSLEPLMGPAAYALFCVGLVAVSLNPFLINAMIGGSILADGIGKPPKLSDRWPRILTVGVLLIGLVVALLALGGGRNPIQLIIFGQALTVIGNPLMAGTLLWLANRRDIMGERRNSWIVNILGGLGLLVVILMAVRVLWRIVLQLS